MPVLKTLPVGISFELADLFMAQGWAGHHKMRLVIELDYSSEGEEYEEVLALYAPTSTFRKWTIWRGIGDIAVQPMMGRVVRFRSVADALEWLIPTRT